MPLWRLPEGKGRPGPRLTAAMWVPQEPQEPQEKWTPQERWIWEQVLADKCADFNRLYCELLPLDPKEGDEVWLSPAQSGKPRQVNERFLLDVLTTPAFADAVPHRGLRIAGAWFPEPLDLSNIVFARQIGLESCRFDRKVSLVSAQLGSNLSLNGSFFGDDVDLLFAKVGGSFIVSSATFKGDVALIGAKVDGQVYLQGSDFTREVALSLAKIGGTLDLGSAFFEGTLGMTYLQVGQDLSMRGATFKGDVDLIGAKINGTLDLSEEATVHRTVDASGTVIGSELRLGSSLHKRPRWEPSALLILRNTSAGALQDRIDTLPDGRRRGAWPKHLQLDGFTYSRLGGVLIEGDSDSDSDSDMMARQVSWCVKWLALNASLSPQPYHHLAGVFRAAGADDKANEILYARRERERVEAWRRREYGKWLGLGLLRAVIGYGIGGGYFRALLWAGLFALAGWLVLWSNDPAFQAHDAVWYVWASLDEIVPLVELNKAHAAFIDNLQGWRLWYFYGQRIAAYVLGSFVVAGLAGLTQGK